MLVLDRVDELRRACASTRRQGRRVGLVPTMGALHAGHLSLVDRARAETDDVVVTIFVNPTQFGAGEDLESYPRDLKGDLAKCEEAGAALVFAPDLREMYPAGEVTRVRLPALSGQLCGVSRPHHFEGVATICTKLFSVVGPCSAVFGRKDYQQFKIVQRLVADLLLPVKVIGAPTFRHADGLAMSSRNSYLDRSERLRATALAEGLTAARRRFVAGERQAAALIAAARKPLDAAQCRVDYVELADADDLEPLAAGPVGERVLLAVAAFLGKTRLIDNLVLGEDPDPIAEGLAE